jgi:hypothetical protein
MWIAGISLSLALLTQGKTAAKPKEAPPAAVAQARVVDTDVSKDTQDEARKLADAYLAALTGKGSEQSRESLLGGATLTARMVTLENAKVVDRQKHRHEEGQLADLNVLVNDLDKEGRAALGALMGGGPAAADDMSLREVDVEAAKKLLGPTREKAKRFTSTHPVFSYVARVDKEVYWHPQNPFRALLTEAGPTGPYAIDLDYFYVETSEGLGEKTTRKWPLRVVRFRSAKLDTGLRILPASDWNAE